MASQNPQSLLELRARGSQPAWGAGGAASALEQAAANSARTVLVGGTGPLLAWLLAEYPGLIWSAAVLSLPAVLLAIFPSEPGVLATSELMPAALWTCWAGVAGVGVLHHNARRRLQEEADQLPHEARPVVLPNLCLSPAHLQDTFERWELSDDGVVAWRVREWLAVAYSPAFHIKLLMMPNCGLGSGSPLLYQLSIAALTTASVYRVIRRRDLSPKAYAMISLGVTTYTWTLHAVLLLAGDACFGGIASDGFHGPMLMRAATSVFVLFFMSLVTPVTRAYLPLKLGIAWLGCTTTSYMHVLYREEAGGLVLDVDPGRWSYLAVSLAVSLASLVHFIASTWRSEASLHRFLRTVVRRGQ